MEMVAVVAELSGGSNDIETDIVRAGGNWGQAVVDACLKMACLYGTPCASAVRPKRR